MNYFLNIEDCTLLGSGAEGAVYLTPEGYAIKVFRNASLAQKEEEILNIAASSGYFPKSIIRISNILIREYVSGDNLYEYIFKNGLSYKLSVQIIDLIEDYKRLNFKRLNTRNAHIFVNSKEKLMVIDPRKPFSKETPYPKDIIKTLCKLHVYDKFLKDLTSYNPKLLPYWTDGYKYVSNSRKRRFYRYG